MKTQILTLVIALSFCFRGLANDSISKNNGPIVYSFFINSVPDGFDLPLIGFINNGRGSHHSAHIGFVNTVRNNINGGQIGFINYAGGNVQGSQIGYINTTPKNLSGAQIGFVNTALQNTNAIQAGFINTAGKELKGAQFGFINTAVAKTNAIQMGFVNTCADSLKGAQFGFVNTAIRRADAAQVGFVNATKTLKGLQLGFVNVADTIESGMPLGFLSIVRKGGYQAIELSVTEMYPINLSFKIGVSKLYTTFIMSYNPANEKSIALGAGLGSILPMGSKFYFNPEFQTQSLMFDDYQQLSSFAANFGYRFNQHLSVSAGPSIVWHYGTTTPDRLSDPFFSFSQSTISNYGRLITGARVALRYTF